MPVKLPRRVFSSFLSALPKLSKMHRTRLGARKLVLWHRFLIGHQTKMNNKIKERHDFSQVWWRRRFTVDERESIARQQARTS